MRKFRKRSGTTDVGRDYETNFITLLALNFSLNPEIQDFELSSNDGNFDCFDDVVIRIFFQNGEVRNLAVQMKHSLQKKAVAIQSLGSSGSGDFSLQKYCRSYTKLSLEDFQFILFTNKTLKSADHISFVLEEGHIQVEAYQEEATLDDLINTSRDKLYKVKFQISETSVEEKYANYGKFFKNFSLFVNQDSAEELKIAIYHLFQERFHYEDPTPFITFIDDWSLRDGVKEVLNKGNIRQKIFEMLISPFIKTLSETIENSKVKFLAAIVNQFDVTVIQSVKSIPNLWQEEEMLIPSVIYVSKSNAATVEKALEFIDCGRKVILIGEGVEDVRIIKKKTFKNLSDVKINPENYNEILEKLTLSLQGRKNVSLKKLVKIDEEFNNVITVTQLLQMCDHLCIGIPREKLPEHYVNRLFPRMLIDFSFITEQNNLSVISCCGKFDKIKNKFKNIPLIEIGVLLGNKSVTNDKMFVCYHRFNCSEDEFKLFCQKNPSKNCHHLRITKNKQLEWLTSSGDTSWLKMYHLYGESVQESEIFNMAKNKINVICGEPGIGKTVVLTYLRNNYPSGFWVVPLNFREQFLNLETNLQNEDLLNYVCNLDTFQYNSFEKAVRDIFVKKKKVAILWDGFDEIPKEHMNQVLEFVSSLSKTEIVQWITVRPTFKTFLENRLQVLSLKIDKFTEKQQRNYIQRSLYDKSEEEVKEITRKIFQNIEATQKNNFLGIPLQIYMLVDLFKKDSQKYSELLEGIFSMTDMYKHFFEEKIDFAFKKSNCDFSNSVTRLLYEHSKMYQLQAYQMLALQIHFNEIFEKFFHRMNLRDFLEEVKSGGDYLGFVTVSKTGDVSFFHNTFGEYFAALWLLKNFKEVSDLDEFFFQEKYKEIRLMFDMIAAQDCLAHLSVLYKNIDSLKKHDDMVSIRDKCGRSPLHLICGWGERHNFLDTEHIGGKYVIDLSKESEVKMEDAEYTDIISFLVQEKKCDPFEKDGLFSWDCITYSCKTFSLRALNFLVSQVPMLSSEQLPVFSDPCSLLYYSVRLNYDNLFKIVSSFPYFEDRHTETNLLHVCAEHGRSNFLQVLLKYKKYLKHIDKKKKWINDILINVPEYKISNICLLPFSIRLQNFVYALETPLHRAAREGYYEIVEILLNKKASVNESNNLGLTPLHRTVQKGCLEVCKLLINNGADVDIPTKDKYTALHYAILYKHWDLAKILFNKAKYIPENDAGLTPLDFAAMFGYIDIYKFMVPGCNFSDVKISLLRAARHGQIGIVKFLIEEKNINVHDMIQGTTLLHCAAANGYINVVKYLLEKKAEVNKQDSDGHSPLHYSVRRGFLNIIKFLIKRGADVNLKNKKAQTSLHYAVLFRDVNIVQFLCENGAEINAVDAEGNTPSMVAKKSQSNRVFQFLSEFERCSCL